MLAKNLPIYFCLSLICGILVLGLVVHVYRGKKIRRLTSCSPAKNLPFLDYHGLKRVILLGDSRISHWGTPDLGLEFDVKNLGSSGQTSREALCLTEEVVLRQKSNWIVIQVGINDLVAASMMAKESRQATYTELIQNLKEIVHLLEESGSKIILMTLIPPIKMDGMRRFVWGQRIPQDAGMISDILLNEKRQNVYVYDVRNIFFDMNRNDWRREYSVDALHWGKEAYEKISQEVAEIIMREEMKDIQKEVKLRLHK